MQVTVTPTGGGAAASVGDTKREGFAHFWLPRNAKYTVDVQAPGFKRKRVKNVHIGPPLLYTATAYVQVKLKIAAPKEIIE